MLQQKAVIKRRAIIFATLLMLHQFSGKFLKFSKYRKNFLIKNSDDEQQVVLKLNLMLLIIKLCIGEAGRN